MGEKLTPKQESFVMAYVETGNASAAYRQAYAAKNMKPETVAKEANRLLENPKVTPMLTELRSSHQERHNVTVDTLTNEFESSRQLAMAEKQASAAVAASTAKAKLHGHMVDRKQISFEDLDSLTDDELRNLVIKKIEARGGSVSH